MTGSMLVGLVGAPNKGKSTLFSAMTMSDVEIADYPFTTIKPNFGVCYATRRCVEGELGVKCTARNSLCRNGIRYIPVNVVDIAGIVPGAHMGKGMGNQFLSDLANADTLIQVVDSSGRTDVNGNACDSCDPAEEVHMFTDELTRWIAGIAVKHAKDKSFGSFLTSFNIKQEDAGRLMQDAGVGYDPSGWSEAQAMEFARAVMKAGKKFIVAANKMDVAGMKAVDDLSSRLNGIDVVGCSAAIELALRKAAKKGVISYDPGASTFETKGSVSEEQGKALEYARKYVSANGSTGVQRLVNDSVFKAHGMIVVYPVEDESKYTDHFGNVLPEAVLMHDGSTALDLAARVHTDLAKGMLYGIDARKKIRVSKEYRLKDNDVIRIVSAAK